MFTESGERVVLCQRLFNVALSVWQFYGVRWVVVIGEAFMERKRPENEASVQLIESPKPICGIGFDF